MTGKGAALWGIEAPRDPNFHGGTEYQQMLPSTTRIVETPLPFIFFKEDEAAEKAGSLDPPEKRVKKDLFPKEREAQMETDVDGPTDEGDGDTGSELDCNPKDISLFASQRSDTP